MEKEGAEVNFQEMEKKARQLLDNGEYMEAAGLWLQIAEGTRNQFSVEQSVVLYNMMATADMGLAQGDFGRQAVEEASKDADIAIKWSTYYKEHFGFSAEIESAYANSIVIKAKALMLLNQEECEKYFSLADSLGINASRILAATWYDKKVTAELHSDSADFDRVQALAEKVIYFDEKYICDFVAEDAKSDELAVAHMQLVFYYMNGCGCEKNEDCANSHLQEAASLGLKGAQEMLAQESPSKNNPSGGCYVATAVYGSYDCPEVWTLRRFRDYELDKTWFGRAFIRTYYAVSPGLVRRFGGTAWFGRLFRRPLDRFVGSLRSRGYADTRYKDNY